MTNIEAAKHVMAHGCVLIRPRKGEPQQFDVKDSVGNKRGWTYLDMQTANAIVSVYNALSAENQAKFPRVPFMRLVDFCWKQVRA